MAYGKAKVNKGLFLRPQQLESPTCQSEGCEAVSALRLQCPEDSLETATAA